MGTSIRRSGLCRHKVTLKLEFTNDTDVDVDASGNETAGVHTKATEAELDARIGDWEKGILDYWNHPYDHTTRQPVTGTPACNFELVLETQQRGQYATPGFHQVRVVGDHEASWSCIWPCCPGTPEASTSLCTGGATPVHVSAWPGAAEWAYEDNEGIAAHECGHLMGLYDEYTASSLSTVSACKDDAPPLPHPQPGPGLVTCLMGCASYPLAVFDLHHVEVVSVLKAHCPWYCRFFARLHWRRVQLWLRYRLEGDPARPPAWPDRKERIPLEAALEEVLSRRDGYALMRGVRALGDHTREEGPARLQEEMAHESLLRRWVAVLAAVADDGRETREALVRRLADEEVNVVVRAASTLGRRRERSEVVPALIGALESEEHLIGHPPGPVSVYAHRVLRRITGHDPGLDALVPDFPREKAAALWRAWWADHGEREGR